jgi:hypothetical protein
MVTNLPQVSNIIFNFKYNKKEIRHGRNKLAAMFNFLSQLFSDWDYYC